MKKDKSRIELGGLFYPTVDREGNDIPFDSLYLPYIWKEIYFEGVYIDVLNGKKDMTIVDIGANVGLTVNLFKDYAKTVYAVEPSGEHFAALQKNKEFNNWDNVVLEKAAIADKDGEVTLSYNTNNRTCNSITNDYGVGGEKVPAIAMDTFFEKHGIEKCDFMKFDVEGADDLILRSEGFKKVADKIQAIEVEFHHSTWPQLVDYMISLGFQARRYDTSAIIILFFR